MQLLKRFLVLLLCCHCCLSYAQLTESQGWLFISHKQTVNKQFDLLGDIQLRSGNSFQHVNTLLLRSALSYNFNKKHSVALGYAYKGDWERDDEETVYSLENRIFQQYIHSFKQGKSEIMLRARHEQRWVKEETTKFSQRTRAFISIQIPLAADSGFNEGLYTGLQNEVFLNTQKKQHANNSFFDQNRSYISIGYRWSKKIDTEVGYMYWFQKETEVDYRRNVIQVMITTNF
jgi:hypothetical protein